MSYPGKSWLAADCIAAFSLGAAKSRKGPQLQRQLPLSRVDQTDWPGRGLELSQQQLQATSPARLKFR